MADTEVIKWAIIQVAVQVAMVIMLVVSGETKAVVLAISGEGRRQNTNTEQNNATKTPQKQNRTTQKMAVSNWNAEDKYMEHKNSEMEVVNIFLI